MGLDTYALNSTATDSLPDQLFTHIEPCLIGGMFSGNGGGASFRGKCYSEYVESVTGVSLYQEEIPTDTVKMMADKLESASKEIPQYGDPTFQEKKALAQWFRVVANENGTVGGWW
jgi:hypothetical protein